MNGRKLFPLALCLTIAGLTGCVTTSSSSKEPPLVEEPAKIKAAGASPEPDAEAPPIPDGLTTRFVELLSGQGLTSKPAELGEAAKLTAAWKNKVVFAPDTTKGGEPMPSLIVRVWLFGPDEGTPISPDGEVLVALWDNSPKMMGGKPHLNELWHIDRETAKKFRKLDAIGDGYTLLLPWSNYNVDIKQVNLVVRYNGADGRALASSPETLSIDHSATLQKAQERLGLSNKPSTLEDQLSKPALRPWPVAK